MTVLEGIADESIDQSFGVAAEWAKPDDIWVEMAWGVFEAARNLGDEVTIEACQRIIDDDSNGDLPAQSDLSAVFGFLDTQSH
jgi:hypothetical protein